MSRRQQHAEMSQSKCSEGTARDLHGHVLEGSHLATQHVDDAGEELADDGVADDHDVDAALPKVLLHLPPRVLVVRAAVRLEDLRAAGEGSCFQDTTAPGSLFR